MWQYLPHLAAMLVLGSLSSFFSASEAALFVLTREDRERLAEGTPGQKLAHRLLASPERLLTSILFCNLVVNVSFFAIASIVGLRLERGGESQAATLFSLAALLSMILFCEMLPKNVAVIFPFWISGRVSLLLAGVIRLLSPALPLLQNISRISLRTLVPKFEREPYLELSDLERAISISTPDKALALREEWVLQQIISLSELEADELMRPRTALTIYPASLTLGQLRAKPPSDRYLLLAESGSGELDRAIDLDQSAYAEGNDSLLLLSLCERVVFVPWCTNGGKVLDLLRETRAGIVGVVNELGETIGVVTLEDLMQLLFADTSLQEGLHASLIAIEPLAVEGWRMSGSVTLRRMARQLKLSLPPSRNVTVAGLLQDELQRLPQPGDQIVWGGIRFAVVDSPRPGVMTVEAVPVGSDPAAGEQAKVAGEEGSE